MTANAMSDVRAPVHELLTLLVLNSIHAFQGAKGVDIGMILASMDSKSK